MKINCLSCGHNVDLDEAYEENYEGSIKCYGCAATLDIKTEHGSVRMVHLRGPRELLERAVASDSTDNHRGGLEHNGALPAHTDKIQ